MDTKHTPGPQPIPPVGQISYNPETKTWDLTYRYDSEMAAYWDFRFMGTAPDLLAALRSAERFIAAHRESVMKGAPLREYWTGSDYDLVQSARAAIARAEGRE